MGKTKYIREVIQSGAWKDKRCFLIGGGPSLKHFDPDLIADELKIGVNKAFLKFNPTINYAMDLKFFDQLVDPKTEDPEEKETKEAWEKYKGLKVFLEVDSNHPFTDDILFVKNIRDRVISFDLNEGIFSGSNSGFGALMLAVALGANPIYLLGYDFTLDNTDTHWHKGYRQQNEGQYLKKLLEFKEVFEYFAVDIQDLGIEVINLNSKSGLSCFSFDTIDNVLR